MDRVIQGDAVRVLSELDVTAQCCVTSPPYYALRDYGVEGQLGMEKTPEEYIQQLVEVFRGVRDILSEDGTLWLNIGDSYKDKQLIGIPWRVALALQQDGWLLRSDIVWNKTNAVPSPVNDRPTMSHEYIFLLSKQKDYYYDADSIRTAPKQEYEISPGGNESTPQSSAAHGINQRRNTVNPKGANRRSVWDIATAHYEEAHFATFPEELVETCVRAGSRVGDLVLDPFSGAATTGVVAIKNLREYVGIELNPEYVKMSQERLEAAGAQNRMFV